MHIKLNEQFFPVLTALLPDKSEATYRRMLELISTTSNTATLVFAPQVIHIDFEMAVIVAVRGELNIEITGCLFHYTQSVFRKVQAIGLQVEYNTDNPVGVRKWIRRLGGTRGITSGTPS